MLFLSIQIHTYTKLDLINFDYDKVKTILLFVLNFLPIRPAITTIKIKLSLQAVITKKNKSQYIKVKHKDLISKELGGTT